MPDPSAGAGEQRVLLARLRPVAAVKDAENAMLRAELDAALERYRRLELPVAELERRLGQDSTNSGTPPSKEPVEAKERRKAGPAGASERGSAGPVLAVRDRTGDARPVVPDPQLPRLRQRPRAQRPRRRHLCPQRQTLAAAARHLKPANHGHP
jgi:hypothetical protein